MTTYLIIHPIQLSGDIKCETHLSPTSTWSGIQRKNIMSPSNAPKPSPLPMELLPNDIYPVILSFLEILDITNVALVSKDWNDRTEGSVVSLHINGCSREKLDKIISSKMVNRIRKLVIGRRCIYKPENYRSRFDDVLYKDVEMYSPQIEENTFDYFLGNAAFVPFLEEFEATHLRQVNDARHILNCTRFKRLKKLSLAGDSQEGEYAGTNHLQNLTDLDLKGVMVSREFLVDLCKLPLNRFQPPDVIKGMGTKDITFDLDYDAYELAFRQPGMSNLRMLKFSRFNCGGPILKILASCPTMNNLEEIILSGDEDDIRYHGTAIDSSICQTLLKSLCLPNLKNIMLLDSIEEKPSELKALREKLSVHLHRPAYYNEILDYEEYESDVLEEFLEEFLGIEEGRGFDPFYTSDTSDEDIDFDNEGEGTSQKRKRKGSKFSKNKK